MDIDSQTAYWDKVAHIKEFTHPLDIHVLSRYLDKTASIIDYGCGYGRLTAQLMNEGYTNTKGFDTSLNLIQRGLENTALPISHINSLDEINIEESTANCVLLFAVLTCIPSNISQLKLVSHLRKLLKPGGIMYISDYYLQDDLSEVGQYGLYNGDANNFGTFSLPEGATFRHHTKAWIAELMKDFTIKEHWDIDVQTMNGSSARAFQMIAQKVL